MIVTDVETTGLDPVKNSIVSIGAVDFDHPECQFYGECRIKEGSTIEAEALQVNGFTIEQVTKTLPMSHNDLMARFNGWYNSRTDRTLAGENVPSFDLPMLVEGLKAAGIQTRLGHRAVDMHSVFFVHLLKLGVTPPLRDGRTALGADTILIYAGLFTEPKPHNALTGAKMEAEAFNRLIYGKPLFTEFVSFPVPKVIQASVMTVPLVKRETYE
ncbi:MAG: 3'-5' exonuclease [Nitrososphaerota archaeon]|jgi:DNA polymerase-3 subunit epsilon|nr:3'-5' exonuclease [Nitrososphaerota archaeon]MDG6948697.1 3'-5' exonuclease [Nitrososphaerota archaeon]